MSKYKWMLLLYRDVYKQEVFKTMCFDRIVDIAYVLNIDTQKVSNYYHGLIKPKEVLKYCEIIRID